MKTQHMFSKLPYVMSAAAIIASAVLFAAGPRYEAKADHGGQCVQRDWEVGGKETSGNWEWVTGDTTVFNATAPNDPLEYISGTAIMVDQANYVEWGWHEIGDTRVLNVVWKQGYNSDHKHYGNPSLASHNFQLGNPGTGAWVWYYDSSLQHQKSLSFSAGQPRSVRENHSSCNSSEGNWSNLTKCNPSQCYWWSSTANHDTDPHVDPQWSGTTAWSAPSGQY